MKHITFVQPTTSSFMETDYLILSKHYRVQRVILHQQDKMRYLFSLIRLLVNPVLCWNTDIFVVWFADYHTAVVALLSMVYRKKMVVLIGGYDAVCYPQLNMGVYLKYWRGKTAAFALKHASLIIGNHASLWESVNTFAEATPHSDGIKHFIPSLRTPFKVIYNGFDTSIPLTNTPKNMRLILMVGTTPTWYDVINKGYDLLIEAARLLPDYQFLLIGLQEKWWDRLEQEFSYRALPNLTIYPYLPKEHLFSLYAQAGIYIQASMTEGMPNALIEAMYFGCAPIGSDVAGIRTVIDSFGAVITHRDVQDLIAAIHSVQHYNDADNAREHIRNTFSFEKREREMIQAISTL